MSILTELGEFIGAEIRKLTCDVEQLQLISTSAVIMEEHTQVIASSTGAVITLTTPHNGLGQITLKTQSLTEPLVWYPYGFESVEYYEEEPANIVVYNNSLSDLNVRVTAVIPII